MTRLAFVQCDGCAGVGDPPLRDDPWAPSLPEGWISVWCPTAQRGGHFCALDCLLANVAAVMVR